MHDGFTILDHPSDLGIEARGVSLAEAFQNAAVGLMSIIIDLATVELRETRTVQFRASDHKQLLVRWLSEILYLYDGQGFVSKEFSIGRLESTMLEAVVRGEQFHGAKHTTKLDVKAVTYHQLLVHENEKGGLVRVYVDI